MVYKLRSIEIYNTVLTLKVFMYKELVKTMYHFVNIGIIFVYSKGNVVLTHHTWLVQSVIPYIMGAKTSNYRIASNYGPGVYFFPPTFHPGHLMRSATIQDWPLLVEVLNQSFSGNEF